MFHTEISEPTQDPELGLSFHPRRQTISVDHNLPKVSSYSKYSLLFFTYSRDWTCNLPLISLRSTFRPNTLSTAPCVLVRVVHKTPEEARRTYRPNRWEYNNKDEVSSLNILSNNSSQTSYQKFRQIIFYIRNCFITTFLPHSLDLFLIFYWSCNHGQMRMSIELVRLVVFLQDFGFYISIHLSPNLLGKQYQ